MAFLAHHFEEGGWGMYPVLWCCVILCALTIERLLFLYRPSPRGGNVLGEIVWLVRVGDVGAAMSIVAATRGSCARIIQAALQHGLEPVPAMESMIAAQLARELVPIRRRLRAFYAIACVATLLGLLGAVTGLTSGFGSSCANSDAASRATMLARGISESLNCTVFGLFVSICALAAGWILHGRADELRAELDETAQQIRNLLVEHRAALRWNGLRAPLERSTYRSC